MDKEIVGSLRKDGFAFKEFRNMLVKLDCESISYTRAFEESCFKILELSMCPQVFMDLIEWFTVDSKYWPTHSDFLLRLLKELACYESPSCFFDFPGSENSLITLPPISKWPQQNGWSFSCWLSLDATNELNSYLYCFKTHDGLGFSAQLKNASLILSIITGKAREYRQIVNENFELQKWYLITVVYVYSRWGRGELRCYINGTLRDCTEVSWHLYNLSMTHCCIGGSRTPVMTSRKDSSVDEGKKQNVGYFQGRLTAIFGFTVPLSSQQVDAIHALGPDYQGQFQFEGEHSHALGDTQRQLLYGTKQLYHSLMFAYHPSSCDQHLCLNRASKKSSDVFLHTSHALLNGNVSVVSKSSLSSALHSLGGIQALYPLVDRISLPVIESKTPVTLSQNDDSYVAVPESTQPGNTANDSRYSTSDASISIAATLLELMLNLVSVNPVLGHQFVQTRGLLLFSSALRSSPLKYLNLTLINQCISSARDLISSVSVAAKFEHPIQTSQSLYQLQLLKHMHTFVFCNPDVWIHAPIEVQDQLYQFLTTEFLFSMIQLGCVNRTSTVIQSVYTLKYYYCVTDPRSISGFELKTPDGLPVSTDQDILKLRANLLIYIKHLAIRLRGMSDQEIQALLNFLATVKEVENLHDVLYLLVTMIVEHPSLVGPPLARSEGIPILFDLLGSSDEAIRIYAIKLIGFYFQMLWKSRNSKSLERFKLFPLMAKRLSTASPEFTMPVYNALFETLTQCFTPRPQEDPISPFSVIYSIRIPQLLPVISQLIRQSKQTTELLLVRQAFLSHLLAMCLRDVSNQRTILQVSLWQTWLLDLAPLQPESNIDALALATIMKLFRCLLHHAIRYEHDGWRVWIDTLAVLHMKMTLSNPLSSTVLNSSEPNTEPFDGPIESLANTTDSDSVGSTLPDCVVVGSDLVNGDRSASIESGGDSKESKSLSVDQFVQPADEKTAAISDTDKTSSESTSQNLELIPNFVWSPLHLLLLDDLICCLEKDFGVFSSERKLDSIHTDQSSGRSIEVDDAPNPTTPSMRSYENDEYQPGHHPLPLVANSITTGTNDSSQRRAHDLSTNASASNAVLIMQNPKNHTFAVNLTHFISDCTDIFVGACGGLLPLLAAATSSSGDIGRFDYVPGIAMNDAFGYVLRLAHLVDFCLFDSNVEVAKVERLKGMAAGSLIRQVLRLYLTTAVRNRLECRFMKFLPSMDLVRNLKRYSNVENEIQFVCEFEGDTVIRKAGSATQTKSSSSTVIDSSVEGILSRDTQVELKAMADRLICLTRLTSFANQNSIVRHGLTTSPWNHSAFIEPASVKNLCDQKERFDLGLSTINPAVRQIIYALRPVLEYPITQERSFYLSVLNSVSDPDSLLQLLDLRRIQAILYKSDELYRTPDHITLAIAYFVSVLMVTEYRELLETESNSDIDQRSVCSPTQPPKAVVEQSEHPSEQLTEVNLNVESKPQTPGESPVRAGYNGSQTSGQSFVSDGNAEPIPINCDNQPSVRSRRRDVSLRLNITLEPTAIFLRQLFSDFHGSFTKSLLGSQGQSLMSTCASILHESQSVIELVMLLCSQEWQNSMQKHAGLAFIELVNEGRVTSRCNAEYIRRVSHEAQVLLNCMDVANNKTLNEFTTYGNNVLSHQCEQDRFCTHLLDASRHRDQLLATRTLDRVQHLMDHIHFSWKITNRIQTTFSNSPGTASDLNSKKAIEFYRLDSWEDDSRRRRRFSRNPHGSTHSSAILMPCTGPEGGIVHTDASRTTLETALLQSRMEGAFNGTSLQKERSSSITSAGGDTGSDYRTNGYSKQELNEQIKNPHGLDELLQSSEEFVTDQFCLEPEGNAIITAPCSLISFGIVVQGNLSVFRSLFRFDWDPTDASHQTMDKKVLVYAQHIRDKYSFGEICAIFSRLYMHKTVALEIFLSCRTSILFAFKDTETMQRVMQLLPPVGIGPKYGLSQTRNISLSSPSSLFRQSKVTQLWQRRELSNFDYLMYLNTIAGRSYNDLNQYPIFPWILSNYHSDRLDLSEPANYRDLSKPIGAIDPQRKAYFDNRYENWEDDSQPPFHYGTHYSTTAFVLSFLIRLEPFTTMFLHLQDGHFDHPDRAFGSIRKTWESCQRNTSDVKELIPEFFYLPEMFENPNEFQLGCTGDGVDIRMVELPPWADSPEEFIRIHRQALESEFVSCQLHHWIDLIFGYKQRGPEAVLATNVFHYLTYEGSVNWSKLTDPVLIKAVEDQIQSFGQAPAQLLHEPHPRRFSALNLNPLIFNPLGEELCMIHKFYSNSPVIAIQANTARNCLPYPAVVTITENRTIVINQWNDSAAATSYNSARLAPNPGSSPKIEFKNVLSSTVDTTSSSNKAQPREVDETVTPDAPTQTIHDDSITKQVSHNSPTSPTSNQQRYSQVSNALLTGDAYNHQTTEPYRHCLGEDFDPTLPVSYSQFTTVGSNKVIFSCGYSDRSFRLFSLETGRLIQAVFGHFDVVSCVTHSEYHADHFCYLATGSRDCTVNLWSYNAQRQLVVSNDSEITSPLVTLFGHASMVTCIDLSTELGIVISGSEGGTCLLHTIHGVLLRQLDITHPVGNDVSVDAEPHVFRSVNRVLCHREGYLLAQVGRTALILYTLNGKRIRSADMLPLAAESKYHLTAVVFGALGRYLLVSGTDGVVWVLRSHSLTPIHAFPRADSSVRSLQITRDQRFVLAGLANGSLAVFYVDFVRWHHEFQERYGEI